MSIDPEQIDVAAWWSEYERILATMVKPNDPNPPPKPQMGPIPEPRWVVGNTFYTLRDDMQFAVDALHPKAVGWNYE